MNDYEVLKAAGHSPAKAAEIALDAHRGDRRAVDWVKAAYQHVGVTFTVVSQDPHGNWRAFPERYTDQALANAKAADIVRGGYPAYVHDTDRLNVIGLPVGPAPAWNYAERRWHVGLRRT